MSLISLQISRIKQNKKRGKNVDSAHNVYVINGQRPDHFSVQFPVVNCTAISQEELSKFFVKYTWIIYPFLTYISQKNKNDQKATKIFSKTIYLYLHVRFFSRAGNATGHFNRVAGQREMATRAMIFSSGLQSESFTNRD